MAVAMEHYWHAGDAMCHLRTLLPSGTFGKWLDDNVSSRRSAYDYMFLRENFTLDQVKEIGSIRAARRALSASEINEDDLCSAAQTTPPPPTETEELRKVNEEESESDWWAGFNEDGSPKEETPEPQPLPVDEVVWEDKSEQAAVLEPEEKVERLSTTDKLKLREEELKVKVANQSELISEQSQTIENQKQRLQLAHDQDRPAAVKDVKLVAAQEEIKTLKYHEIESATRLRDAKAELSDSLRKVKYLAKKLDARDKKIEELTARVEQLESQAESAQWDPFV